MEYWKYLSCSIPKSKSGIEYMPFFYRDTIAMTCAFTVLYILLPIFAKIFFNKWFYKLDKKKQDDFPSYAVCLIHHFLLVPRSWLSYYYHYYYYYYYYYYIILLIQGIM